MNTQSVDANYVDKQTFLFGKSERSAGDFTYVNSSSGKMMMFVLPGDPSTHGILLRPCGDKHPSWEWDGDVEHPTLNPSILSHSGEGWHGYLRAGRFVSC